MHLEAEGIGDMDLVYVQFRSLYVPNFPVSLLSISQLSEEYLFSVLFKPGGGL